MLHQAVRCGISDASNARKSSRSEQIRAIGFIIFGGAPDKQDRMGKPVFGMIEIDGHTVVAENELVYRASRSGGPGGQNVNKVNTRITLLFDVRGSACLSDDQKGRIMGKLASRIDKQGVLRVVCQKHRTQEANRRAAAERLQQLLTEAVKPTLVRRKTEAPASARERRLSRKKRRGQVKRNRSTMNWLGE
jgi:ribosome-associated protein